MSALESYETVEDAILIDVLHYRSEPSSTAASSGRGGEVRVRKRVLRTKKKLHDSPAVAGEDDTASSDESRFEARYKELGCRRGHSELVRGY